MKLDIMAGSTDVSLYFHIRSSVDGSPLTGLAYNSTNLQAYFNRDLAAPVAITLATQTVTGAHTDGGFVEVSSTLCPGLYRLDVQDVAFATGVRGVRVYLSEATTTALNLNVDPAEIQLSTFEKSDPTSTDRLPNIDEIDSAANVADAVVAEVLTEPTNLSDKTVGGILYHIFSRFYHTVTQTSSSQIVRKADGVTALGTMAVSDNGTTQTKGEASEN